MSTYSNRLQPALQNLLQRVVRFFHLRLSCPTHTSHISADVCSRRKSLVKPVTRQNISSCSVLSPEIVWRSVIWRWRSVAPKVTAGLAMATYATSIISATCRPTSTEARDQLWNPTLVSSMGQPISPFSSAILNFVCDVFRWQNEFKQSFTNYLKIRGTQRSSDFMHSVKTQINIT